MNNFFRNNPKAIEDTVMGLADDMASAATTFGGQGYNQFIQAREQFKSVLHILITTFNLNGEGENNND